MDLYIARLESEIADIQRLAAELHARLDRQIDSVYMGGGTPTTLSPGQLRRIFTAVHNEFEPFIGSEVTVECAPGTLRPEILEMLVEVGTNRISLGVQSFVDREAAAVGRLHTAAQVIADIAHLREHGIDNINVDLIAGLPHQTAKSWKTSLEQVVVAGVPHVSVYILEVDEDSRLGRELLAGGARYHAHHVPDTDLAADLYLEAIEFLEGAGIQQYEISNFARPGFESRHNLKYWTRQPYLGFGLDAHSMLCARNPSSRCEALRFSNTDDLDKYLSGNFEKNRTVIDERVTLEEKLFLGLRLNRGIDLAGIADPDILDEIEESISMGLLVRDDNFVRLTSRGRLLSNEVFERFIAPAKVH
jgi:oxygen-independent coproporphyrinogen-3 oxidase